MKYLLYTMVISGLRQKAMIATHSEIAKECGNIFSTAGNAKIDNLIAATARVNDLVVAPRTIRHFCILAWNA